MVPWDELELIQPTRYHTSPTLEEHLNDESIFYRSGHTSASSWGCVSWRTALTLALWPSNWRDLNPGTTLDLRYVLTPRKGTAPRGLSAPPKCFLLSMLAAVNPALHLLKWADLAGSLCTLTSPEDVLRHRLCNGDTWETTSESQSYTQRGAGQPVTLSFTMVISRLSMAPMLELYHTSGTRTVLLEKLDNSDLQP